MRRITITLAFLIGLLAGCGADPLPRVAPPDASCVETCDPVMGYWCGVLDSTEIPPPVYWTWTGPTWPPTGHVLCSYHASSATWVTVEEPWMCIAPESCCYSECINWGLVRGDLNADGLVDLRDLSELQLKESGR